MHLLQLLAEVVPSEPTAAHISYDIAMGVTVAVLGGAKLLDVGRAWGVIPENGRERTSNGYSNGKTKTDQLLQLLLSKSDRQIELLIEIATILRRSE